MSDCGRPWPSSAPWPTPQDCLSCAAKSCRDQLLDPGSVYSDRMGSRPDHPAPRGLDAARNRAHDQQHRADARPRHRQTAIGGSPRLWRDNWRGNAKPALRVLGRRRPAGLVTNSLWGWWWLDPLAGLAVAAVAIKEGRAAWRGENCSCAAVPGLSDEDACGCGPDCTDGEVPFT